MQQCVQVHDGSRNGKPQRFVYNQLKADILFPSNKWQNKMKRSQVAPEEVSIGY